MLITIMIFNGFACFFSLIAKKKDLSTIYMHTSFVNSCFETEKQQLFLNDLF